MILDVPYVMRGCKDDYEHYEKSEHDVREYDEDRGVSGKISRIYDPEERIQLLLVHGMLHLVGYDHIEDNDYELMVKREEEVIDELLLRM